MAAVQERGRLEWRKPPKECGRGRHGERNRLNQREAEKKERAAEHWTVGPAEDACLLQSVGWCVFGFKENSRW